MTIQDSDILKTLERGFPLLRFEGELEQTYQSYRFSRLIDRGLAVTAAALLLNLAYVISDIYLLPEPVSELTVAIRAGVLLPSLILVILMGLAKVPARLFFKVYYATYLVGGLAIIAIGAIAQQFDLEIPYEGLLLIMMFGYLVMGIPFYFAFAGAMFLFLVFVVTELFLGLSVTTVLYNVFFIMTANVIGAIGCYMQEKSDRQNFLSSRLLARSKERAETESQRKTRLLAEASHDLRQPLQAMTLMAEGLSSEPLSRSAESLLGGLKTALLNLNHMLSSLLDMSRLETGIVTPSKNDFELRSVLEELLVEFESELPEFELRCPDVVHVHTDRVLLARLLRNVLINACKHAEASRVLVRVRPQAQSLTLEVSDNGKGMDLEFQKGAFDPYVKSQDACSAGLGLGLSIVSDLAELLDLNMKLESEPDEGTHFYFYLPAAEPVLPDREAVEERSQVVKGQALVADDDPLIRQSCAQFLSRLGYRVEAADSLSSLEQHLLSEHFDVLITDVDFDARYRNDSLQALQSVLTKSLSHNPTLAVVVMTGNSAIQRADFDYRDLELLYKPVSPAKLKLVVEALVSNP